MQQTVKSSSISSKISVFGSFFPRCTSWAVRILRKKRKKKDLFDILFSFHHKRNWNHPDYMIFHIIIIFKPIWYFLCYLMEIFNHLSVLWNFYMFVCTSAHKSPTVRSVRTSNSCNESSSRTRWILKCPRCIFPILWEKYDYKQWSHTTFFVCKKSKRERERERESFVSSHDTIMTCRFIRTQCKH